MTTTIQLRDVIEEDLPIFFEHQRDPEANYMVAFIQRDPEDRETFFTHWNKILRNDTTTKKTILVDGRVAGNIISFEQFGRPSVAYWIGKEYWGRGVTTEALRQFLKIITTRPLYARAAKDNLASLRVLEKCGFVVIGSEKDFAKTRGKEIEEMILELKGDGEDTKG